MGSKGIGCGWLQEGNYALSDALRDNAFTMFSMHLSMTETERCGIAKDFMVSYLLPKTVLITTDLWFCGQPEFIVHERLHLENLP